MRHCAVSLREWEKNPPPPPQNEAADFAPSRRERRGKLQPLLYFKHRLRGAAAAAKGTCRGGERDLGRRNVG